MSRAQYDAQIYTDDAEALGRDLSKEVSKESALDPGRSRDQSEDHRSGEEDSLGAKASHQAQAELEQSEQSSI